MSARSSANSAKVDLLRVDLTRLRADNERLAAALASALVALAEDKARGFDWTAARAALAAHKEGGK